MSGRNKNDAPRFAVTVIDKLGRIQDTTRNHHIDRIVQKVLPHRRRLDEESSGGLRRADIFNIGFYFPVFHFHLPGCVRGNNKLGERTGVIPLCLRQSQTEGALKK